MLERDLQASNPGSGPGSWRGREVHNGLGASHLGHRGFGSVAGSGGQQLWTEQWHGLGLSPLSPMGALV